tara:strand:+ start:2577 stop:2795 length:219 start_codon:yes stop_codon:yes gene_type:complete
MTAANNMNINPSDLENIICDSCGNETFKPTFVIKKISALVSPTGKETLAPIQIFKCDVCGHINELFLEGLTN